MELVIALSSKIYLKLEEDKTLRELDEITTKYQDEESLVQSMEYQERIENFYKSYKNYIENMNFKKSYAGTIKIHTNDNNLYNINVLYKKNKNKMNTRRLIGGIERALKGDIDIPLLLSLSRICSFFLDSDYNYLVNRLGRIRNNLYLASSINDSVIREYNQLVNIIRDEMLNGYNKKTKEVTKSVYNYARFIDSYLENKNIITLKELKRLQVDEKKIKGIKDAKLIKEIPLELKGRGISYYMDYLEEENERLNDIDEEEYIIGIDSFSFEEKDDKSTWFK